MILKKLEWDSRIFGFNCAELDLEGKPPKSKELNEWIYENDIQFVISKVNSSNKGLVDLLERENFNVVEEAITLRSYLDNLPEIKLNVREFTPEDIDEIAKISSSSFGYSRFFRDKGFEEEDARELYKRWAINCCKGRSDSVIVVDVDRKVGGFITCNLISDSARYGCIQLLAVAEQYRGRGIGKSLVGAAQDWLKENGCKYADVSTQRDNSLAVKLYESSGFKKLDFKKT